MRAEEVATFRRNLEESLNDFELPEAYGVGVIEADGVRFPVVNRGGTHHLPGVVLASVLGYRSGTCAIATSAAQLQQACEVLGPVEACTDFGHPNLWGWRELLADAPDGEFVTVFVAADGDGSGPLAHFRSLAGNTD